MQATVEHYETVRLTARLKIIPAAIFRGQSLHNKTACPTDPLSPSSHSFLSVCSFASPVSLSPSLCFSIFDLYLREKAYCSGLLYTAHSLAMHQSDQIQFNRAKRFGLHAFSSVNFRYLIVTIRRPDFQSLAFCYHP